MRWPAPGRPGGIHDASCEPPIVFRIYGPAAQTPRGLRDGSGDCRRLGAGKKLLEQYSWWRFEPHPEWAPGCFAAGIPGEVRFIYLPRRNIYNWDGLEVKSLEPDVDWHAYYFDPATGRKFDQGIIESNAKAAGKDSKPVTFKNNVPSPQDWVLVLERVKL